MEKKNGVQHQVGAGENEEDVVLPGFRFHPTDEELVGFYLRRKVDKKVFSIAIIKEVDIYKHEPWDIPKIITGGEKEWYFFCLRERKYRNSIRPNRVTGSGFWKATGIDRPIYSASNAGGNCIGLKKSLVYYRGSAGKGTKTDWMLHEFRLPSSTKYTGSASPSTQEAEIWTICRIFKRNDSYRKHPQCWQLSSTNQQNPTESSSKSSSVESDGGIEYKSSRDPHGDQMRFISAYCEDSNQFNAGNWNSVSEIPLTTLHSNTELINQNNVNDFFKDSNWDELGRILWNA